MAVLSKNGGGRDGVTLLGSRERKGGAEAGIGSLHGAVTEGLPFGGPPVLEAAKDTGGPDGLVGASAEEGVLGVLHVKELVRVDADLAFQLVVYIQILILIGSEGLDRLAAEIPMK